MVNEFSLVILQLAFAAAVLNIQIPMMLGDLVNVVARHMREQAGHYMRDIRTPAVKLLGLYALQVRHPKNIFRSHVEMSNIWLGSDHDQICLWFFFKGMLTSGYIILLSRVGERVAANMRKTLFSSLLRLLLNIWLI